MAWLEYYAKEHRTYPEYYNQEYKTAKQAHKITKKLLRHFKLSFLSIYYDMTDSGMAGVGYIRLPRKNITLGVICHEIGHHVARKKTGKWGHTKKTWMKMRQVYRYAKRYLDNV